MRSMYLEVLRAILCSVIPLLSMSVCLLGESRTYPINFYFLEIDAGQTGIFQIAIELVGWEFQEESFIIFIIAEDGIPDRDHVVVIGGEY